MAKTLDILVDTKKVTALSSKLRKYPRVAILAGLTAAQDYLNTSGVKSEMYPPKSSKPFEWSSDRQRAFVMAKLREEGGPPYQRTYELRDGGEFTIDEQSLYVGYSNDVPYSKWVIHPSTQIRGMIARGWKAINVFITKRSATIARVFRKAALDAWDKINEFVYGGGAGL